MTTQSSLNIEAIRRDFPALHQQVNGNSLIYLDNAATTQKPIAVIESMTQYYARDNANVHRGLHALSIRATEQFETVREKVQRFINAPSKSECIFVSGTTAAVNLVAQSYVGPRLYKNEGVLLTQMEHHSNIVPWQLICQKQGARLEVAPISLDGEILLDEFEKKLQKDIKFVAISHVSNALGTINPIKKMIEMAHAYGALVLIDGAQATPHLSIDVQDLNCDFYAFSAHKMYGPTGIGVLWGKEALLDDSAPWQGGGDMITSVSFDSTEYAPLPHKFEAGTPNIGGVIGLGACIDYLSSLDIEAIRAYEADLLAYATEGLHAIKGFALIGTASEKVPVLSFVHNKIHPHDIGTILDNEGIAIRAGHHCAMPLMDFLELTATARLSFSFYNTKEEIDKALRALEMARELFS